MSIPESADHFYWCGTCRRSYGLEDLADGRCPVCGGELRQTGKYSAMLRGLMGTELVSTSLRSKHRQLVKLIWTRNGKGESYYKVLAPDMTYGKFEARVTELICRAVEEGWATVILPPAPSIREEDYRIEFTDDERFVEEMAKLAASSRRKRLKSPSVTQSPYPERNPDV